MTVRANGANKDEPKSTEAEERLDSVLPGDVLEFWSEGTLVVQTVFHCKEEVDSRTVEWSWMFLDDGSLVEVSLDGLFRYRAHEIVKQGSALYEELVAQDGALVRFEEHVRAGTSGRRPVHVMIDEKQYQITSTGTLQAVRLGEAPTLIPWNTFSSKPDENVYFGMVEAENEDNVALGLWTAHICLSRGQAFERSDVTEIYRRGKS
jgi:hypothetical protein